jgi:hypothetical protein
MSPSSDAAPSSAIGAPWLLLRRLDAAKHAQLAAQCGIDAGEFSRFVNGKSGLRLPQIQLLIAALDLKVVDRSARCVGEDVFLSLTQIAGRALTQQPKLLWEDEDG